MRVVIIGNSGSGKSTLARALAARHGLAHLDLDAIVWEAGAVAVERPRADVERDLARFIDHHDSWVIEGCYAELAAAALPRCTELLFLNPGPEACLAHNRARPWEPHKYATAEAQDSMLEALQQWVSDYYHRSSAWSYAAHRALFDGFAGRKSEHTRPLNVEGQRGAATERAPE